MSNKYFIKRYDKDRDNITIEMSIPPILYKYKAITEHSVDALVKDEIWATVPSQFNDPYDSITCYDEKKLESEIKTRITADRLNNYKIVFQKNSKDELVKLIKKEIIEAHKRNRNTLAVASFSEMINSEIMWAHYANNAKGFALGYDGNALFQLAQDYYNTTIDGIKGIKLYDIDVSNISMPKAVTLFPIQYENTKTNIDNELVELLDKLFNFCDEMATGKIKIDNSLLINKSDLSILYSSLIRKNRDWKYEKEWRVWAYNNNVFQFSLSPYVCLGYVRPLAIYLGEFISSYDEIALMEIAKQKGIAVYKMKTKMYKNRCKLNPIKIYDGAKNV